MNVTYVNPFIRSTLDTFATMVGVKAVPGKPGVKTVPYPTYDISGIIGLSGDAQGSIAISFPKVMALRVVSKLLGVSIKIIGPEVVDGIGELANIVAGNAKKDLAGMDLSISLPNVVIGKDHIVGGGGGVAIITVPFGTELGDFAMEVSLKTR